MNLKIAEFELSKQKADNLLNDNLLKTRLYAVQSLKTTSETKQNKMTFKSPLQQKLLDLEIQKYIIEIDKLSNIIELQQKIHQYEITKITNKIVKNRNQVQRAQLFTDRLTLTASANGLVLHEMNPQKDEKMKEGDRVWRRLPILKIHDMENVQIIAEAKETTIQRISPGQRVDIYIDAVPGKCFNGHVHDVASVGTLKNKQTRIKGYEIRIDLDTANEQIMPGFSATCHIFSLTIPDTIVIPLECVFYKDSLTIVYIEENKKYREREVNIARRNENFALIRSGLNNGERVSLEKPPIHLIISNEE